MLIINFDTDIKRLERGWVPPKRLNVRVTVTRSLFNRDMEMVTTITVNF